MAHSIRSERDLEIETWRLDSFAHALEQETQLYFVTWSKNLNEECRKKCKKKFDEIEKNEGGGTKE